MDRASRVPAVTVYAPAHSLEWVDRALEAEPDGVIIDLEDGTPADERVLSRLGIGYLVERARDRGVTPIVRINGWGTEWFDDDVAAVLDARPDAVLLPKADRAGVADAWARLAGSGVHLWALIESAKTLLALRTVLGAAELQAVIPGYGDLCRELQLPLSNAHAELDGARRLLLSECQHAGVAAVDGVVISRDVAEVESACRASKVDGFAGRTLYHPSHVAPCRRAFAD